MNTGPTAAWCEVQDVLRAAPKMGHARSLRERVAFLEERLREEVERRMELEAEALDYDMFKERFEEQIDCDDAFASKKEFDELKDQHEDMTEKYDERGDRIEELETELAAAKKENVKLLDQIAEAADGST